MVTATDAYALIGGPPRRAGARWSKLSESAPVVLVQDGRLLPERARKSHVSEDDVLQSAWERLGLESMDQIKYAILEKSGGVTVIPREVPWAPPRSDGSAPAQVAEAASQPSSTSSPAR